MLSNTGYLMTNDIYPAIVSTRHWITSIVLHSRGLVICNSLNIFTNITGMITLEVVPVMHAHGGVT